MFVMAKEDGCGVFPLEFLSLDIFTAAGIRIRTFIRRERVPPRTPRSDAIFLFIPFPMLSALTC